MGIAKQITEDEEMYLILKYSDEAEGFLESLDKVKQEVSAFMDKLEYVPIKIAIYTWLNQEQYSKKSAHYITELFKRNILHEFFVDGQEFTVGGLRNIRHQAAIDYIKKIDDISEDVKNEMIECYTSFINYLDKISYGWFKKASLNLNYSYRIAPDISNKTLSFADWRIFIDVLSKINIRDELIARCIIQGTKRVSEVLDLTVEQIDFQNNIIHFKKGKEDELVSYDAKFIEELKEYLEDTSEQRKNSTIVFVTRTGKKIVRSRLNYSFAQASIKANVSKVTPEVLRATWITLKQQGYKDVAIMQRKKFKKVL